MTLTARLVTRSKAPMGILSKLALGSLAFVAFGAQAATCTLYDPTYSRDITIPILGPGVATAGEDLPIGTVLYSQTYRSIPAPRAGWDCKWSSAESPMTLEYYKAMEAISTPFGSPVQSGTKTLYPTNVPGIGITFVDIGTYPRTNSIYPAKSIRSELNTSPGNQSRGSIGALGMVAFELVKTGPISTNGNQQIQASSFPVFQKSWGMTAPVSLVQKYWTIRFSGVINIVTKTCQVEDITVDLGSHQLSDFPKTGSASEWKSFNIALKNCPPFYGYAPNYPSYSYTEATGVLDVSGRTNKNKLNMRFLSVHGNYSPYVAKTESGPGTAEGFGIQIATEDSSSANIITSGILSYSDSQLKINLTNTDGATYLIPLKARYYRYGSNPRAGRANGAITYTVNYL